MPKGVRLKPEQVVVKLKDRVQRIWRREALKVPKKQRPRRRLWLGDGSCVRLRAQRGAGRRSALAGAWRRNDAARAAWRAISRLFERGLNPMEVAAISGHKTLQMLKRYTHLRAEDLVARLG